MQALAEYSLRPMLPSDVDAVLRIESEVYDFPWTRGNFNDSLNAKHQAWVMALANDMIGYAVMMLVIDEAHLFNLSISRAYQRQGLGQALLNDMIKSAQLAGATQMFLEVRAGNAAARSLYEKMGFSEVHVRRGYYQAAHGREDAINMCLKI